MILKQNKDFVDEHNAKPESTFKMKLYPKFAGLTPEEVREKYFMKIDIDKIKDVMFKGGKPAPINPSTIIDKPFLSGSVDEKRNLKSYYIDLNSRYGTPVQNQGACGNCYAFSATDTVNMNNKLFSKNYPLLSFQQLTDCSSIVRLQNGVNYGCGGGSNFASMEYIMDYGLQSLASYPQSINSYNYGQNQPCASRYGPYRINMWYFFPYDYCGIRV